MRDLYLEAMMRGDFVKKKKDIMEKDRFEIIIEKNIQEILSLFTYEEKFEEIHLETSEMKRIKLKNELRESLKNEELSVYIDTAITTLVNEGKKYLETPIYELMLSDFVHTLEFLDTIQLDLSSDENINNTFHFQSETIDAIFQIAIDKFEEERFEESLSIFVLLILIQVEDHNYWYRTGIVAQHCQKYELALKAYNRTIILNSENFGAHLFIIECYLKLNKLEEARENYEKIKQLHKISPLKDKWLQIFEYLGKLIDSYKNVNHL